MAITKADITFQASASNAADATTTATGVNLSTGYGATINVRITNGATAPTIACQCDIEVSNDGSDWYVYRTVYGNTVNSDVTEASIEIPIGHQYVRTSFHGNTGQAVTIEADGSNVTGV